MCLLGRPRRAIRVPRFVVINGAGAVAFACRIGSLVTLEAAIGVEWYIGEPTLMPCWSCVGALTRMPSGVVRTTTWPGIACSVTPSRLKSKFWKITIFVDFLKITILKKIAILLIFQKLRFFSKFILSPSPCSNKCRPSRNQSRSCGWTHNPSCLNRLHGYHRFPNRSIAGQSWCTHTRCSRSSHTNCVHSLPLWSNSPGCRVIMSSIMWSLDCLLDAKKNQICKFWKRRAYRVIGRETDWVGGEWFSSSHK